MRDRVNSKDNRMQLSRQGGGGSPKFNQCATPDAIRDFRTQAERVLESFRFEMPEDYFRSLEARFVAVERSPPARNFILCKSESEFGKRYRGFGGSPSFALSGVNAFTTVWKNDPSPSPLNRLIVIRPAWTPQTLFHELLHWSTHREYDTAAKAYRGTVFHAKGFSRPRQLLQRTPLCHGSHSRGDVKREGSRSSVFQRRRGYRRNDRPGSKL